MRPYVKVVYQGYIAECLTVLLSGRRHALYVLSITSCNIAVQMSLWWMPSTIDEEINNNCITIDFQDSLDVSSCLYIQVSPLMNCDFDVP